MTHSQDQDSEEETDLERFLELYRSFGIRLTTEPFKVVNRFIEITKHQVLVKMDVSNGFEGYVGFYSVATFDESGKFICQGFYED